MISMREVYDNKIKLLSIDTDSICKKLNKKSINTPVVQDRSISIEYTKDNLNKDLDNIIASFVECGNPTMIYQIFTFGDNKFIMKV